MSRHRGSLPSEYFEALYARADDPWDFSTSDYEAAKYDQTLTALTQPVYRRALEVGCSIGVLTARLAQRCQSLVAIDVAERALAQARVRCEALSHIVFLKQRVPREWPAGRYDLVVLSEVVYYLSAADVGKLAHRIKRCVEPNGTVLLVHWTGATDYPLSGDAAAKHFIEAVRPRLQALWSHRAEAYRLDRLTFA